MLNPNEYWLIRKKGSDKDSGKIVGITRSAKVAEFFRYFHDEHSYSVEKVFEICRNYSANFR